MSDFGSIIICKKKNLTKFSETEINQLNGELSKLLEKEDYTNAFGDPFNNEFQESYEEEVPTLIARLSEHYFGEDKEEDINFVEEVELYQVEELQDELSTILEEFEFKAEVAQW